MRESSIRFGLLVHTFPQPCSTPLLKECSIAGVRFACHRHSCPRAISAAVSLVRALLRSTSRPAASDGHVSILARHRPSPVRQFLWGRRLAPRSGRPSMRARSRSMRARRSSRARTARAHSYPIGSSSICARCVRFRESQWSLGGKSPAPPTINHVLVTGVSFAVRQGQLCQPNAATWRRSS